MYVLFVVFVLFLPYSGVQTANILCLPTYFIYSHVNEMTQLVSELPKRGHSVYMLVHKGFDNRAMLEDKGINIIESSHTEMENVKFSNSEYFEELISNASFGIDGENMYSANKVVNEWTQKGCANVLYNNELLRKLRAMQLDMVIVDGFIVNPCWSIVAYHLGVPFIETFTASDDSITRIPNLPSFKPFETSLMSDNMSFLQRVGNTVAFLLHDVVVASFGGFRNLNKNLLEKFGDGKSIKELRRTAVLHLLTRNYLLEWPYPTMPNVIFLGGVTMRPASPLDKYFKSIVDSSKHELIICSFGSMAGQFPAEVTNKLASAFKRMKETVIWRFTGDTNIIEGEMTENVIITKWMPQSDLLAQNKTKLFITHCGNNGQYEALYHGVPMIGMPVFAEQHHNAFRVAYKEFGLHLDIRTFTTDQLVESMNEVINNSKYSDNIKKYSAIVKDARTTPREEAAYWIEHVIKFGGKHLRSHAIDMPWYQYWLVDVIVFIKLVILVFLCLLKKTCTTVSRQCCRSKQSKFKTS